MSRPGSVVHAELIRTESGSFFQAWYTEPPLYDAAYVVTDEEWWESGPTVPLTRNIYSWEPCRIGQLMLIAVLDVLFPDGTFRRGVV